MPWISQTPEGTVLHIQVQPKASKTSVVGPHGNPPRLKVRVAAPPVDGEANAELIRFLKKTLDIPASRIHIVRGEKSKAKDILCQGISRDDVLAALAL